MHIKQVMGGVHLQVRTCASADVPGVTYLGNSWTDCAEIWCVVRDQFAMRFTLLRGGVHLHVRTRALLSVSWERLDGLRRNLVCC